MRNAIPRRSHKERAQPSSRKSRGLLEKRKDYLLRAKDYNSKQKTLTRLTEKAQERNPDEFYFGMMRERTENGVPVVVRERGMSVKDIRPLKKQDGAYLRTLRSIERGNIARLRGIQKPAGKKILFAENEEEGMLVFLVSD